MVFHAVLQSARLVVMPSIVKIIDRNVTETFFGTHDTEASSFCEIQKTCFSIFGTVVYWSWILYVHSGSILEIQYFRMTFRIQIFMMISILIKHISKIPLVV